MPTAVDAEMTSIMEQILDDDDFISFLLICAEHLKKGESVRAIWRNHSNG